MMMPTPNSAPAAIPRAEVAALRAILEALQARLTFIAGSRDDMGSEPTSQAPGWRRHREADRWLREPDAWHRLDLEVGAPDASIALDLTLEALSAAGVRTVAAIDLTRPEIGLPIFRVVAAGLEGASDASDYVPGHRAGRAAAP